jgi:hypothetical protein
MDHITFNGGYKYQLKADYTTQIEINPAQRIATDFIQLEVDGTLTLFKGYAWDGPSGPTIDTLSFMRGSLIHDGLYQLFREGHLDRLIYRDTADRILQRICLEDGMWPIFAWLAYLGVHFFGAPSADPANDHPPIQAPRIRLKPQSAERIV